MEFQEIYSKYLDELQQVEELLFESVRSENPALEEAATGLLRAGGKRIRPLFTLLCSKLHGEHTPREVFPLAAAMELVHMATLVHDDVIDGADTRRGAPTVRAVYGNRAAMYTGDFLFARAIQLLCKVGDVRIHREMSDAIVRMCVGEIEQIQDFYNWRQGIRNYFRRVERKTALLISVSCSLGATVAKCTAPDIDHLRRFGYYTGMAFQITDDVLDYVGDASIVGKPVGGDLRQGNLTLPALFASWSGSESSNLPRLVHEGMDASSLNRALDIVRSSDALSYARDVASRFRHKATTQLQRLSSNAVVTELEVVAQFVNQRSF